MMIKFSKSTASCALQEFKTCFVSQKAQQVVISKSPQETQKIGRILGEELKSKTSFGLHKSKLKNKQALVIGLEGDLGGGKTTFVQGLAQGLGIKKQINSPSFVLIKKYRIRFGVADETLHPGANFRSLFHIDCYRLNKPQELLELDFDQIIKNPRNLVVIEWAEKVKNILPEDTLKIEFKWLGENKRKLIIKNQELRIKNQEL